jgi:hypothetical protein
MNEPGERTRALNNVFKGGGGLDTGLIERLRNGKGPLDRSPTDLAAVRVLRGHCPLGIRDYLSEHVREDREVHYFTFLRDPVDRILSHYFPIREGRRGYGSDRHALAPLPADPTLDDLLETGYIHDNLHTRMLSGLPEPFGEVTDAMLEQAKGNLRDGLIFFGLTERFDESVVLAKQRLGFRSILYKTHGRLNSARPRGQDVPEKLREAAERCNRYDIELYRYAQELFDRIPERRELEFEVELAALRAAKGEGAIAPAAPAPEGFAGGKKEWRMLLHARALVLRLEWQIARRRARVADTGGPKALQNELTAAQSRIQELEDVLPRDKGGGHGAEPAEPEPQRAAAGSKRGSKRAARRAAARAGPGKRDGNGGNHG